MAKQLSVFIENKEGMLKKVLNVLKVNDVNILSLSLADTTEYGLLRLIVNKPEIAREKLIDAGFSSMIAEVIIVKVQHKAGSLQSILELLADEKVNIEYTYVLTTDGIDASIVIKTNDLKKVREIAVANGIETVTDEEISKH